MAKDLRQWLVNTGAKTLYIEPGSPSENGYRESFNSKLRDEFLNGEIFYSMKELRVLAERWRVHYNTVRPHSSLGYKPPAPEAWLTNQTGHGEEESKQRFPLLYTPDHGGYLNSTTAALSELFTGTKDRALHDLLLAFRYLALSRLNHARGNCFPRFGLPQLVTCTVTQTATVRSFYPSS